eukprot:6189007-Pleurochrysis_carterae.AAC.4
MADAEGGRHARARRKLRRKDCVELVCNLLPLRRLDGRVRHSKRSGDEAPSLRQQRFRCAIDQSRGTERARHPLTHQRRAKRVHCFLMAACRHEASEAQPRKSLERQLTFDLLPEMEGRFEQLGLAWARLKRWWAVR